MTADPTQLRIPEDAMRRLAEMRPGQADQPVHLRPVGQRVPAGPRGRLPAARPGARLSIYHVGFQIGRWSKNQELDTLSQAMYHARELAMTRMEAEADQLGADGIVGVRLEIEFKEFGTDIAEFIAIGTAVKADEPAPRTAGRGATTRTSRSPPTCPARTSGR